MRLAPRILLGLVLISMPSWPAADNLPLDVLLDKHVQARGGHEAWSRVKTLFLRGTWEAFSDRCPLKIYRQRPGLFRFEYEILETPSAIGFDGETIWQQTDNARTGKELTEFWKDNVVEDAAFPGGLLHHIAAGTPMELLGLDKVDGMPAWKLNVRLKDGREETWYLDADTYLEVKRTSFSFDRFGSPGERLEMETYYMDFREVDGIVIPFREERHFGIRYRVIIADTVRVNTDIDPALFAVPDRRLRKKKQPTRP